MTRLTRLLDTSTSVLGPNRVEAIAGTSAKARDGHIVEMRGMDISAFLRSGAILWGHDPDQPVGNPISGRVDSAGNLRLVIDFAPDGISARADEIRRLVKSGIVRCMSIGFDVLDAEPLDPAKPRGGLRVTRSELLECSFTTIPADSGALVTARAARAGKMLSGANADALRQAHDHVENGRAMIAQVLDGAGECPDPDDGEDMGDQERRRRMADLLSLKGIGYEHEFDADFDKRQRQLALFRLQGVHLGLNS